MAARGSRPSFAGRVWARFTGRAGRANLIDALAVIAVAQARGLDMALVAQALERFAARTGATS